MFRCTCLLLFLIFTPSTALAEEIDCDAFTVRESLPVYARKASTEYEELRVYKVSDSVKTVWVKKEPLFNGRGVASASLGWFTQQTAKEKGPQDGEPRVKKYPLINIHYTDMAIARLSRLEKESSIAYVLDNRVLFAITLPGPMSGTSNSIYSVHSDEDNQAIIDRINSFTSCK